MNGTEAAVTTTLVHRIYRGKALWWQRAAVCTLVIPFDEAELGEFGDSIIQIARVGFNAVVIRPARIDLTDSAALEHFIAQCHRVGLKVIVRLSGSSRVPEIDRFVEYEHDPDTILTRASAALAAGADGIDLNALDWDADTGANDRFSAFVRMLQAEIALTDSQAILGASTTLAHPRQFHHHLEEDWFHHLRDDALSTAPWDADVMRQRITASLSVRDRLGHITPWQVMRHRTDPFRVIDPPPGSWGYDGSRTRELAMMQFCLSLPGAAYIGYQRAGGTLRVEGDHYIRRWAADDASAASADLMSQLLRIRAEKAMATGSLAFVEGLEWMHDRVLVAMCAGVMVVLNMSDTPVAVPAEHRLLAFSGQATGNPPGHTYGMSILPPDSCAWFDTARVTAPVVSPGY